MSPSGVFYMVVVVENKPDEIAAILAEDGFCMTVSTHNENERKNRKRPASESQRAFPFHPAARRALRSVLYLRTAASPRLTSAAVSLASLSARRIVSLELPRAEDKASELSMSSSNMRSAGAPGERQTISKRFTKARRRGNSQEASSSGSSMGSGFGPGGVSPVGSGAGNNGLSSRNTISGMASFGKAGSAALSTSPAGTPAAAAAAKEEAGFVSSKTGFLTKRAMSSMDAFANWKERFFVLAEGHLSYYKQGGGFFNNGKEDIVHLKGELELTPDTIVRKSNIDDKANCFEVVTPTKKMFAQAS
ncbi:hypothetical protein BBJ28_00016870, partial [Nothophytophthora sp. Chile5]